MDDPKFVSRAATKAWNTILRIAFNIVKTMYDLSGIPGCMAFPCKIGPQTGGENIATIFYMTHQHLIKEDDSCLKWFQEVASMTREMQIRESAWHLSNGAIVRAGQGSTVVLVIPAER